MFLVLAIGLCAPALAGDVAFSSPAVIAASPAAASALVDLAPIASADLDQDGDRDVVAAFRVGALTIFAWLENAPAWLAHPLASLPGSATALCSGDLDGDGDQDIALTTRDPGIIAWLENDGAAAPGFTLHVVAASGSARSVSAADVNQDGKLDLLLVNNGNVLWLENDGGSPPSFIVRLISTGASCAEAVAAADLDGDGDLDAVSASPCDGKIRWHENDGAAAPRSSITTSPAPRRRARDRGGGSRSGWRSRRGSRLAGREHDCLVRERRRRAAAFAVRTIGGADAAVAVAAVDLDHDARLDVLAWSLASPPSTGSRTTAARRPPSCRMRSRSAARSSPPRSRATSTAMASSTCSRASAPTRPSRCSTTAPRMAARSTRSSTSSTRRSTRRTRARRSTSTATAIST
ncbi:MAG: VCBS repeat-containing protein [Planctomycetota bacterium]